MAKNVTRVEIADGLTATRREGALINAVDPRSGKTIPVQIRMERVIELGRRSKGQSMECGFCVPEALQKPNAIFEGLRYDADEDRKPGATGWRCYCTIPSNAFHDDGTKRKPYPNEVFLVFVNDQKVAYNWRWEKANNQDGRLPEDHRERFRERLI